MSVPRNAMKELTVETQVGDMVRAVPARSRVFESLGIDYCCGGKRPLAEVCRSKGLDPVRVLGMLREAEAEAVAVPAGVDPDAMGLAELCDHIERVHHDYLRDELPRLDFMTRKVAAVHGEHEPRLLEIREVFEGFRDEIVSHTREEEAVVFPLIRDLARLAGEGTVAGGGGKLGEALGRLEREHERAGGALERLSELSDRHTPPEWACNTFRALYDALGRLERNMHQHVHKENNVLFPRALAIGGGA